MVGLGFTQLKLTEPSIITSFLAPSDYSTNLQSGGAVFVGEAARIPFCICTSTTTPVHHDDVPFEASSYMYLPKDKPFLDTTES